MTRREPSDEAILAARLQRAYPTLSPYACARFAMELCAIERMQRKHAERKCNGSPDVRRKPQPGELFGYVKTVPLPAGRAVDPTAPRGMTWDDDPDAEERVAKRIGRKVAKWIAAIAEHGNHPIEDPEIAFDFVRLELRLPGEQELKAV